MPLKSRIFLDNDRLEQCRTQDFAHVKLGDVGDHVELIQNALILIDNLSIDDSERAAKMYGPSTASAVLKYKTKRNIINTSYQNRPDDIVGKMTITALDNDMLTRQETPSGTNSRICNVQRRAAIPSESISQTPSAFTLKFFT
jgi:hypothetical protein